MQVFTPSWTLGQALNKLSFIKIWWIKYFGGSAYIGSDDHGRPSAHPRYLCYCKKHGFYKASPAGYEDRLECKECLFLLHQELGLVSPVPQAVPDLAPASYDPKDDRAHCIIDPCRFRSNNISEHIRHLEMVHFFSLQDTQEAIRDHFYLDGSGVLRNN